jgi:(2Fe-2S) ferredoxin
MTSRAVEIEGSAMEDAEKLFYRAHVFLCTNVRPAGHPRGCCAEKGSEKLRDYMKARAKELGLQQTRINTAGCLDRCELGPTMVIYPEGVWYTYRNRDDIDEILERHLIGGEVVDRLRLAVDQILPAE